MNNVSRSAAKNISIKTYSVGYTVYTVSSLRVNFKESTLVFKCGHCGMWSSCLNTEQLAEDGVEPFASAPDVDIHECQHCWHKIRASIH